MKKKLLIFSDCFIFGGSELVLVNLMQSRDILQSYDTHFAYRSFSEYTDGLGKYNINDIRISPLRLYSSSTYLYRVEKFSYYLLTKVVSLVFKLIELTHLTYFYNYLVFYRFFKCNDADVILINNGGYPGSDLSRMAVKMTRFSKCDKVIFVINNMAYPVNNCFERNYDFKVDLFVTTYVTASHAAKVELNKMRGFDLDKIINIPNTVKFNSLNTPDVLSREYGFFDGVIFGAVGLLTKRKGFDYLVYAIKYLVDNIGVEGGFKVFIFGDGEEKKALLALIDKFELGEFIYLVGFKSNILDYIKCLDFLVIPSVSNEDMPYVLLEAMMFKKPVVGTKVAGIPEVIVDGTTGYLVEPKDYKDLAFKISCLIENAELRGEFSLNAGERFNDNFEYDVVMRKYLELFDSMSVTT
jgi:glycosyltransferase involved in cell wall biosynthesis